ncbi:hypothetical protein FQA47_006467 [Oryzias melastigma]|uniref:Uncharacterized protein n=1 Tax=Oryzias melastigma TaxID=30732 RepID=A0A834FIT1_ORYME|nr:hypothetical protein FQA47_006467 [Oryzias melastigma]
MIIFGGNKSTEVQQEERVCVCMGGGGGLMERRETFPGSGAAWRRGSGPADTVRAGPALQVQRSASAALGPVEADRRRREFRQRSAEAAPELANGPRARASPPGSPLRDFQFIHGRVAEDPWTRASSTRTSE